MEKIIDLQKYKEAKAVVPHLEAVLKIFTLAIKALSYYRAYICVARVLIVLEDEKMVLESHLYKYRSYLGEKK